jgi:hypothetical protein
MILFLEWFGCVLGIVGAALLALNNRWSGYGFVLFLVSNVVWIAFGVLTGANGLVTMQIAFSGTSLMGIWQWLIKPRLEAQRVREVWHG